MHHVDFWKYLYHCAQGRFSFLRPWIWYQRRGTMPTTLDWTHAVPQSKLPSLPWDTAIHFTDEEKRSHKGHLKLSKIITLFPYWQRFLEAIVSHVYALNLNLFLHSLNSSHHSSHQEASTHSTFVQIPQISKIILHKHLWCLSFNSKASDFLFFTLLRPLIFCKILSP